jgi:hypothetical protein
MHTVNQVFDEQNSGAQEKWRCPPTSEMANVGIEPKTSELLARRSNQLS